MKKIIYLLLGFFIISKSYADDSFWFWRVEGGKLDHWDTDLVASVDGILGYFIWLLYFVAVVIWLYGWFIILTSWWEEEKVKKWKNYVIYMVIWLFIIFLASTIVRWVIEVMSRSDITW